MVENTEVRIRIEEVIERYCDGTFLNGLKSAAFVGNPQSCADEIISVVFGILEDEESELQRKAERAEADAKRLAKAMLLKNFDQDSVDWAEPPTCSVCGESGIHLAMCEWGNALTAHFTGN